MAQVIRTEYRLSDNENVYPECPFASPTGFISNEVNCNFPSENTYCSEHQRRGDCPLDKERKP
jgi:hypothetical protein